MHSYKQLFQELKNLAAFQEIELFDSVCYASYSSFPLKYYSWKLLCKNE